MSDCGTRGATWCGLSILGHLGKATLVMEICWSQENWAKRKRFSEDPRLRDRPRRPRCKRWWLRYSPKIDILADVFLTWRFKAPSRHQVLDEILEYWAESQSHDHVLCRQDIYRREDSGGNHWRPFMNWSLYWLLLLCYFCYRYIDRDPYITQN